MARGDSWRKSAPLAGCGPRPFGPWRWTYRRRVRCVGPRRRYLWRVHRGRARAPTWFGSALGFLPEQRLGVWGCGVLRWPRWGCLLVGRHRGRLVAARHRLGRGRAAPTIGGLSRPRGATPRVAGATKRVAAEWTAVRRAHRRRTPRADVRESEECGGVAVVVSTRWRPARSVAARRCPRAVRESEECGECSGGFDAMTRPWELKSPRGCWSRDTSGRSPSGPARRGARPFSGPHGRSCRSHA